MVRPSVDGNRDEMFPPLISAAHHVDLEMARLLLNKGAEVDRADHCGRTPLMVIAEKALNENSIEFAKCLLANGADVNARDEDRHTPLHHAAGIGSNTSKPHPGPNSEETQAHKQMMSLLLSRGADATAVDKYESRFDVRQCREPTEFIACNRWPHALHCPRHE